MTRGEPVPFRYTVWDKLEGKLTGQVMATDEHDACWKARYAASDRGCSFVEEILVESLPVD